MPTPQAAGEQIEDNGWLRVAYSQWDVGDIGTPLG